MKTWPQRVMLSGNKPLALSEAKGKNPRGPSRPVGHHRCFAALSI